jgi:hypothetical protein
MKRRKKTKYVHEGQYAAEVDVELVEDESEWSPYLSVEGAYKLDDVRDALRQVIWLWLRDVAEFMSLGR